MVKARSLDEVFEKDVVVVEFFTKNCPACRKMKHMLEKFESAYPYIHFCEVDAEEHPEIASQFYVASVPVTFLVADGTVIDQINGAVNASVIEQKLTALYRIAS